jgi:hypothetical protein
MWEAFFATGARALRRASLDGRSRKLLTPFLGWVMNWERVSVETRNSGFTQATPPGSSSVPVVRGENKPVLRKIRGE